jgi:hypothetical protein
LACCDWLMAFHALRHVVSVFLGATPGLPSAPRGYKRARLSISPRTSRARNLPKRLNLSKRPRCRVTRHPRSHTTARAAGRILNTCAVPSVYRHARPALPRDRPRSARAVAGAHRPSAVDFFTTRCVLSPEAFARNFLSFSRGCPSEASQRFQDSFAKHMSPAPPMPNSSSVAAA